MVKSAIRHDFIVVGKDTCKFTIKAVKMLEKQKKSYSFIYHRLGDLSRDNFEYFSCEMLLAAALMTRGKAKTYGKVPIIFVKDKKTDKYDFLENGSSSLEELLKKNL